MFSVSNHAVEVYYSRYLEDQNEGVFVTPQKDWFPLEAHCGQRVQEYPSDLSDG